ncbi:MAG: hypothetical protein KGM47_17880, partial [Acidobacteriota bacterium]|nr:hypothetical protein [Acidobacteriota bacterium]
MSSYHYRRGAFFWALILIAIGVIFLAENFNPAIHPWHVLARYWPVLIIIWGLSKLIDYVMARRHPESSAPPLFSGSEVIILILVLILGTILSRVILAPWQQWRTEWGMHWNPSGWNNPFLRSYTFTQTFSEPAPGKTQLIVTGRRGDVMIEAADAASVSAVAKETIRAANENDANDIHNQLKIVLSREAGRVMIQPSLDSLPHGGQNVRLDWTIRTPKSTSADITARNGDILVSGLTGSQSFTSGHGDVHASNLAGTVRVDKSGGSAEIRGVTGEVEITGRGSDLVVSHVSGAVTVEGEFNGSVQFASLDHGVSYKSSRTLMSAAKLSGTLNMEMGSLEASGVEGPFSVTTRQKDISVRGFKGGVTLADQNGNIALHAAGPPTSPINVSAKNGDIILALPPGSRFSL